MQTLHEHGRPRYASAEAANVEQQLLGAINAPTMALLGRPLIGHGADGAPGTGQAGGAGGILYGNGGNGIVWRHRSGRWCGWRGRADRSRRGRRSGWHRRVR
ncbi:predicted protein [Mycobacterium tuberculosis variant africanum K85]|uniref:Uncharacterized protein n=1 Tax=Mycobacterium tuberculosis variant africanum K85 TaxID=611304 RepID=A0A9P2H7Y0_MYCTX|nr:predicted protein [Mycobacterium tuberculosis variant africanum K85]